MTVIIARFYRDAEHAIRFLGGPKRFGGSKPAVITTEADAHRVYGQRLDPRNVILVDCARGLEHSWLSGRSAPEIARYLEDHGTPLDECSRFVLP